MSAACRVHDCVHCLGLSDLAFSITGSERLGLSQQTLGNSDRLNLSGDLEYCKNWEHDIAFAPCMLLFRSGINLCKGLKLLVCCHLQGGLAEAAGYTPSEETMQQFWEHCEDILGRAATEVPEASLDADTQTHRLAHAKLEQVRVDLLTHLYSHAFIRSFCTLLEPVDNQPD